MTLFHQIRSPPPPRRFIVQGHRPCILGFGPSKTIVTGLKKYKKNLMGATTPHGAVET